MYCPKCGNEMDIFADKCLKCGKNFRGMSLAERKRLEDEPAIVRKIKSTPVRMTYDNGIPVGE